MKSAFSHSELRLYQYSPDKYYERYVLGKDDQPNKSMQLGSIIHAAIENQMYGWQAELKEKGFTRGQMIAVRTLLDKIRPKLPTTMGHEIMRFAESDIRLMAIYDGYDEKEKTLYEFKTSDNRDRWNQFIVDTHQQLSFYAYIHYLNTHSYLRNIKLFFLDTKRGNVQLFETVRSYRDIQDIKEKINKTVLELKKRGWWEKRLSRKDRELKRNHTLLP